MPKIIIEPKISLNGREDNFKLRINDEGNVEVKSNGKTEIDVDYGEQTLQIYNNLFAKTPKKIINVESDNQKYKITLHYKAWGIVTFLNIIMILSIFVFAAIPFFTAFMIVITNFLILIFMGIFEIREIKRKDNE